MMTLSWVKKMVCCVSLLLAAQTFAASGSAEGDDLFRGELSAEMGVDTVTLVSGLKDVSFFSFSEAVAGQTIPLCIFTNAPSGQFKLTVTSSENGSGEQFNLTHSNGANQIRMKAKLYQGATELAVLHHGALEGPFEVTTEDVHCTGADSQKHDLKISLDGVTNEASLLAGRYTGTFTLRVDAV